YQRRRTECTDDFGFVEHRCRTGRLFAAGRGQSPLDRCNVRRVVVDNDRRDHEADRETRPAAYCCTADVIKFVHDAGTEGRERTDRQSRMGRSYLLIYCHSRKREMGNSFSEEGWYEIRRVRGYEGCRSVGEGLPEKAAGSANDR